MLWRSFKKLFTHETVTVFAFISLYIICRFFDVTCLIYKFTQIPCPTCYMSRALCSLLRGNFSDYINYNIMAVPLSIAFLTELYIKYLYKYRKLIHCYSMFVLLINMIYYLSRLILGRI